MAIAERVARTYSLEVFDVQFRREAHGWVVRVYLDRADRTEPAADGAAQAGVNVADCERVSRDLGAILDVEDVVNRAYTLEVSSPGLDRPLRAAADYRRFAGQRVKMVVTEPVDNQTFLTGRLRGLEEDAGGTVLLEGTGRSGRPGMHVLRRRPGVIVFDSLDALDARWARPGVTSRPAV